MNRTLTADELRGMLDPDIAADALAAFNRWLGRGDGVAVYRNEEIGHPEAGHRQFVSFGSPEAQLEVETPPGRMPDIGGAVNWRYWLEGTYRGPAL